MPLSGITAGSATGLGASSASPSLSRNRKRWSISPWRSLQDSGSMGTKMSSYHYLLETLRTFCGEKSYFCQGAWYAGTGLGSGPTRYLVCPHRPEAVHPHRVVFDGL